MTEIEQEGNDRTSLIPRDTCESESEPHGNLDGGRETGWFGNVPSSSSESSLTSRSIKPRFTIPRRPVPGSISRNGSSGDRSRTSHLYESISAPNIELQPLNQIIPASSSESPGNRSRKEWKPVMLRLGPGLIIVLTCWGLVVLLEGFDMVARRRQGFSTDNENSVKAARYLPTVAVILLGFAWKSLVSDLKLVTPFSVMSHHQWSETRTSVLLDYIEPLVFVSVWTSIRYRHWAIFLGLLVGLLSGILVPCKRPKAYALGCLVSLEIYILVANSLTFVSLYSPVDQYTTLSQTTKFSFQGALSDNNGTLTIPWDYTGNVPYAAVASARQPNGKSSPWTVDDFAFDSFDIKPWSNENATVSAAVQAFYASLNCSKIEYEFHNDSTLYYLKPREDTLVEGNCQQTYELDIWLSDDGNTAACGWLNVTDCSEDESDLRMLATVLTNPGSYSGNPLWEGSAAVGFMCTPHYFSQEAYIQVNGSTGNILNYNIGSQAPNTIDINTTIPVIYTYLNNPLDEESQHAFIWNDQFTSFQLPQATFQNVTNYATQYVHDQRQDIFFNQLFESGRTAVDYINDPALLQSEMGTLANTILTQIASSWARGNVSQQIDGSVTLHQPRLLVRATSLRAMQTILVFMGLVGLLCCTALRPKSRLAEDPSNLAAVSVVLSASEPSLEKTLQSEALSDTNTCKESLNHWKWRLSHLATGQTVIESDFIGGKADLVVASVISFVCWYFLILEIFDGNASQVILALKANDVPAEAKEEVKSEGYRPFAFRAYSMMALFIAVCAVITALATLLRFSVNTGGFRALTATDSAAWSFVPSTILVLLEYGLSSVQNTLRILTPYLALHGPNGSRTLRHSNNSSILFAPLHAIMRFRGFALAASSITILLFPFVKVLAAGLYTPVDSHIFHPVEARVDTSIVDRFEAMYDEFPLEDVSNTPINNLVKEASNFVEWISIPSFNVSQRGGIINNLVFSNLTGLISGNSAYQSSESVVSLKIPAIAVDITCSRSLGPEHFITTVAGGSEPGANYTSFTFTTSCPKTDEACNATIHNELFENRAGSNTTWSKFNITMQDPLESTSHRYQGTALVGGYRDSGTPDDPYGPQLLRFNTSYLVTLGAFPNIDQAIVNQTLISNETALKPGMFNVPIPISKIAVSCDKALWKVAVDVKLTRGTKSGVNGNATTLPWTVSEYDPGSIEYLSQYNNNMPIWTYPKPNTLSHYKQDSIDTWTDSFISSDTLWPEHSKSTNVFELLAAYQQFQAGNLTGLMDPAHLASAVVHVWTSYVVQMLTELRPYALKNSSAAESMRTISGTIATPITRMKQDTGTTIAICTLLFFMLIGLGYVFLSFPRETLLAKPPTTIAAQMALLAGSELVKDLRRDGVTSVKETRVWQERFRLGWWPMNGASTEERGWRWGIDIVKDD